MTPEELSGLKLLSAKIRRDILVMLEKAGSGHLGGSMSIVELMSVLYGRRLNYDPKNPRWEDRDWFVLSKGHGGPVMYAPLGLKGYYPMESAYTLNQPGTDFPSHTDRRMTVGVDLTTGSLGQGMSEAVGAALGSKVKGRTNHVFVAVGDGECDEGEVWEAAQFAAHYKLDNLVCLVDNNKRQLDGAVADVMSHGKGIGAKFDAFGWHVIDVKDGNDVEQISAAIAEAYTVKGQPTCLILNTVKGKGATFAEPSGAHSSQPTKEQWDEAIAASEAQLAAIRAEQ